VASEETAAVGEQARHAIAVVLIEKVRQDKHPSSTQMDLIEQIMPPHLIRDYLNVLLEKVLADPNPSIPLLGRAARIAQRI
jgi:hypothetical protein